MNSKPRPLAVVPNREAAPESERDGRVEELEHAVVALGEVVVGLEERVSIAETRADLAEGRQVADATNARLRLDALEARPRP